MLFLVVGVHCWSVVVLGVVEFHCWGGSSLVVVGLRCWGGIVVVVVVFHCWGDVDRFDRHHIVFCSAWTRTLYRCLL